MFDEQGRRKVTFEEIEKVKEFIKHAMIAYLNKQEMIDILQAWNVEPQFTSIIWDKLEEQNQEFFQEYNLKLTCLGLLSEVFDQIELRLYPTKSGEPVIPISERLRKQRKERAKRFLMVYDLRTLSMSQLQDFFDQLHNLLAGDASASAIPRLQSAFEFPLSMLLA